MVSVLLGELSDGSFLIVVLTRTISVFLRLFSSGKVPPVKDSKLDAVLTPEASAGWFSLLTFQWMTSLLCLGYARPLEVSDLYKLQDDRAASEVAGKILASYEARRKKAASYNLRLARGDIDPGWRAAWWFIRGDKTARKRWQEQGGVQRASLILAMNDAVKWWFWSSAIMKVIGDTAQLTSPLLVKVRTALSLRCCLTYLFI